MAYIGKEPTVGNFQKCDALTASATADYTLQVSSTNVVPESVNHMIVSLNGVIQQPTTSYTVSGSTLSFASALTSNDTIDFVMLLGNVLDIGTPSDDTVATAKIQDDAVTAAKINTDLISGTTALASEPADTDEFLVSDAGTLKRIDYSLIKGGGKVLQLVSGVDGTTRSTTSTSFVTASNTCTCAITPSATSSKILLMFNSDIYAPTDDQAITIYRDSTNLGHASYGFDYAHSVASIRMSTIIHLDSPSTTSEVTYQIYIKKVSGSGSITIGNNTDISSLQAIEIGA